jgi:hypothetical protein
MSKVNGQLERVPFEMSRAAEYFDLEELQTMTGRSRGQFAAVVLKELTDNALDAAETVGVAPIIRISLEHAGETTSIQVADNGHGIPPDLVRRVLDFSTRTSDKAAYRSPTRGQLGNALKTVLGMPFAFGLDDPVTIEACGVRHVVLAGLDPAGQVRQDYAEQKIRARGGTIVGLSLPPEAFANVTPALWARRFALFNPHAEVGFCETTAGVEQGNGHRPEVSFSYQPTVSTCSGWRKFLPSDKTSPWWYDPHALAKLIFAHIANTGRGSEDKLLRDFVREFRGVTMSGQAKAVCDRFPGITRLSDFVDREDRIRELLAAMQSVATKQPRPAFLGYVGKDHFERCFDAWGAGVRRFWYRRVEETHKGLPYVVEVAIAETVQTCGAPFTGINFSPTFGDPLMDSPLESAAIHSFGLQGFLERAHALPNDPDTVTTAAALHIVCPHLSIQDKGKTKLDLPSAILSRIAEALWLVTKDLYREGERRRRDAARQERSDRERQHRDSAGESMPLNRAIELVMPEAIRKATGDGAYPVSAHTLFYHIRPLVQEYNTQRQLKSHYFEQKLLPRYQRKHGVITGLYYEPRGTLYEPHSGRVVPLGTREVSDYTFPSWLYDGILYVEKKGLWPVLHQAGLAERLDIAIVAGEGYSTEACRVLFANAEKGRDYKLWVQHDADPYGYNIARTLREETERMPEHRIEIIDIGLTLADALEMGLGTETYTRKKAIPQGLTLTDQEQEYFVGRRSGEGWIARRVELNAMSGPQYIQYTEAGLRANGLRGKVIPDKDSLPQLSRALYQAVAHDRVQTILDELIDRDQLLWEVARELADEAKLGGARSWIRKELDRHPYLSWNTALRMRFAEAIDKHKGLRDLVFRRLTEAIGDATGEQ